MRKARKEWILLLLIVVVGGLLGTVVGDALGVWLPVLARPYEAGLHVRELNLAGMATLQLGIAFRFNLVTLIGVVLGLFAYWRM
ncbi:MAG: DUF4321 domain-containing protein [Firmicutes bacterium]|nr:DUF4321 domain-containing protein [Bacillota bacterium]